MRGGMTVHTGIHTAGNEGGGGRYAHPFSLRAYRLFHTTPPGRIASASLGLLTRRQFRSTGYLLRSQAE